MKKNNLSNKIDITMNLVHGNRICIVDSFYKTIECDGLISKRKDITLFVHVADCLPILFFDPSKEVIAVAHGGREGTFRNIVGEMINSFQDNFDSITLKQPLTLALDTLLETYNEKKQLDNYQYLDNLIYQILILAVTMSSDRLNMEDKLSEVIDVLGSTTIKDEFYLNLLEGAIESLGSSKLREQKQELLYPKKTRKSSKINY